MPSENKIFTVIVTYNRKYCLQNCITAIINQTHPPDVTIVVDNASTDGTEKFVRDNFADCESIQYINPGFNLGGAGGFHYGAKLAFEKGADWIWMMDDDCIPEKDCLEKLLAGVKNKRDIYSPIILSSGDRSTVLWGMQIKPDTGKHEVNTLPFNGFFINKKTIQKIGLPDKRFFIYGDDAEYNFRAKSHGSRSIVVTGSKMYHPFKNQVKGLNIIKMFMSKIWVYYKFRNAIIIHKKYGYHSVKQILMLVLALLFYILTLNFNFIKLWIEALNDGLKNKLYVRKI